MPTIQFQQIFALMQIRFKSSWFGFLFRFTAIGQLLKQGNQPSAYAFFSTFMNSWWWNRLWFRSRLTVECLYQFDTIMAALKLLKQADIFNEPNCHAVAMQNSPSYLAVALTNLQQVGLLTPNNRDMVVNHLHPDWLVAPFYTLSGALILNQENFDVVICHAQPATIASALSNLEQVGILTPENRVMVASHSNPNILARGLLTLEQAQILTSKNREMLANHANPYILVETLKKIQCEHILNQDNFDVLSKHVHLEKFVNAISSLLKGVILNQDNFDALSTHVNPECLANALNRANHWKMLTPENREVLIASAHPENLAYALLNLQQANMLSSENRAMVANHANLKNLADVISSLRSGLILNQENFDSLITPNHVALITDEALYDIWNLIPPHLITQANFVRLLTAAEQPNPMAALTLVRDQIIRTRPRAENQRADFNPRQSTHTASVHRSVSTSAVKLKSHYGQGLNLNQIIVAIKVYINGLEETQKHQAAKRCMAHITSPDYSFTDSSSKVSTLELLALSWLAIHDSSKCQASVEDAKNLFVDGLYEIQRGYNLDDFGNDLGGYDSPICLAGTFNKLMEKLNGIHQDVEVYYITHEGASAKFPKLIQAHAIAYLQSIVSPKDEREYEQVSALLARLKESGNLEPIWDNIKEDVKAELWGEFKEAYGANEMDARFINLINFGNEAELPNLDEIEAKLKVSEYSGLQVYSLWANRQTSPQAHKHNTTLINNMV